MFTCFNTDDGWLRKSFISTPNTFGIQRTKKYSTFLGIYSCNSKRKSCGMCEQWAHTHSSWMREKTAVLHSIPTVRVNQTQPRAHKHSKCSFCAQFGSIFITRWRFFHCLREWITFIHRYPALSSSSLTFYVRTYVSFLLVEMLFVWSMHTALIMRSCRSVETHAFAHK